MILITLDKLRWYMFSKKQLESEKLPSTNPAFLYVVYRSHFMTRVMKSASKCHPHLPDPETHDWKLNEGLYEPIMTDQLPAPKFVIELSMCSLKTGCETMRCTCRKKGLQCAGVCLCVNCNNDEEDNINDNST